MLDKQKPKTSVTNDHFEIESNASDETTGITQQADNAYKEKKYLVQLRVLFDDGNIRITIVISSSGDGWGTSTCLQACG